MTSLLVIIVLVLLAIALWQLTKIFDLTQVGEKNDDSQVANDDDNNVQGYLMFVFLVVRVSFLFLKTNIKWINLYRLPNRDKTPDSIDLANPKDDS